MVRLASNVLVKGFPAVHFFPDTEIALLREFVSLEDLAGLLQESPQDLWHEFWGLKEAGTYGDAVDFVFAYKDQDGGAHLFTQDNPDDFVFPCKGEDDKVRLFRDLSGVLTELALVFLPRWFAERKCEPIRQDLLSAVALPDPF